MSIRVVQNISSGIFAQLSQAFSKIIKLSPNKISLTQVRSQHSWPRVRPSIATCVEIRLLSSEGMFLHPVYCPCRKREDVESFRMVEAARKIILRYQK